MLSSLVHEPRRENGPPAGRLPQGAVGDALRGTFTTWGRLRGIEGDHDLSTLREPDAGIAWAVQRWARGQSLDSVLRDTDLAAGDFVRRCKRLVDLLGQVASASDDPAQRRTALTAVDLVLRSVVDQATYA
ncbi:hypothetical protein GCM10025868_45960 [Angustibacter aerolatus]|uniref:ATP-dependent RNA helicase Ski2/MTR4 C-terminal domain-containing protein n=1 Tax=Angustibacter aerolatus TaxID=1162965 RepID=A0ABQ6JD03_9ACTN|nr:hypothetical protein GCM10025868_00170 [Angustibacter aerolatus]GMA89346.1 hypothetical protein GCM10025868_45960 [Angustibacter aerolatus]